MRRRHLRGRDLAEGSDQSRDRKAPGRRQKPQSGVGQAPDDRAAAVSGTRPSGPDKWSGQIYNADDGNGYASNISVAGPDAVEGCVGALCVGETWTRSAR
jgi:uncharacterized protein (DUF2147 family)